MGPLTFLKMKTLKKIKNKILLIISKLFFKKLHKKIKIESYEDNFYYLLHKIKKSNNRAEKYFLIKKAQKQAKEVPRLKGWPNGPIFWDIESENWNNKIHKEIREFLKKEIKKLISKDSKNLSIGSGSFPYIKNSILLDYSKEMLNKAPKKYKRILFNLNSNKKIPLPKALRGN